MVRDGTPSGEGTDTGSFDGWHDSDDGPRVQATDDLTARLDRLYTSDAGGEWRPGDQGSAPGQYVVAAPGAQTGWSDAPVVSPPPASPPPPAGQRGTVAPPPMPSPPAAPRVQPKPAAPVQPPVRTRRRRRPLRTLRRSVLLVVVVALVGTALYAWVLLGRLGRVDVADVLDPATGGATNVLLVGSDSREGLDSDTVNLDAFGAEEGGRRADTMIVLRIESDGARMMSVPRDLWVTNAETGEEGKINGSYNQGPANLIRTVKAELGIPIHRYVEVGFGSFAGVVDAMGGITIDFEHPASDPKSGLSVPSAGPVTLDGQQALAYVRSRTYTEIIDGDERVDPTADLGRQQRQQAFMNSLIGSVSETRSPLALARVASAGASQAKVDDAMGLRDMWSIGRGLAGRSPTSEVLPTSPRRFGSAAALVLIDGDAAEVLARMGATG